MTERKHETLSVDTKQLALEDDGVELPKKVSKGFKYGKVHEYCGVESDSSGGILGECFTASRCGNWRTSIDNFAPADGSSNTARKRAEFFNAIEAYSLAHEQGDTLECTKQRDIVHDKRRPLCNECAPKPGYRSPNNEACKRFYDELRKDACAANNGCAQKDCAERGDHTWQILTADHGTNPKKKHKITGHPISLSKAAQWVGHGGVEGMELESKQIEKWICRFCHRLEPTSSSGNRSGDPITLSRGKYNGTKEEIRAYNKRLHAVVRYPKQCHVDETKREIAKCSDCHRPVRIGQEAGFDFNHIDEATKGMGGLFGKRGGVGGLVNNCAKAASLENVKELLDTEMAKCNLLCSNCHHRHTWKYPKSLTKY